MLNVIAIALSSVAIVVGGATTVIVRRRLNINALLNEASAQGYREGYDAGWEAASEDIDHIKECYDEFFPPFQN